MSRYIAQLGAHLVSHAPGLKWPFTFHVVASSDINAFALPGGAIFVNLGTVQAAQTEAQLAGVIAHETSHVVLRHSTCNMKKQQTTNLLAGVGTIASRILLGNGAAGQIGQAIIGAGNGLYGLRMSRDDEKQADLLGTDILYNTGYDPRGMPQFFEIIQAKYGSGGAQLLTDHPNPGNRTQYVDAEIATLPQRANPIVTSAAFSRVHSNAMQERTFTAQQIKRARGRAGATHPVPGSMAPPLLQTGMDSTLRKGMRMATTQTGVVSSNTQVRGSIRLTGRRDPMQGSMVRKDRWPSTVRSLGSERGWSTYAGRTSRSTSLQIGKPPQQRSSKRQRHSRSNRWIRNFWNGVWSGNWNSAGGRGPR